MAQSGEGEKGGDLERTVAWLRAAGEPTRLRLLALLDTSELTVSDLTSILDQSQPRISRHLKLLVDAGLAQRFQEGAWAYFRTSDDGPAADFLRGLLSPLTTGDDEGIAQDLEKLEGIRQRRSQRADSYFAANAAQWDRIRSLHVAEDAVDAAMLELGLAGSPSSLLDLGTGTGSILKLFAPHVRRGVGIDKSHDMLSVARASLGGPDFAHIQVRHGDVYQLTEGDPYDLVVLHQVLHFLEDPEMALRHAQRRLASNGTVLIVDFLPHSFEFLLEEHAHRRMGVGSEQLERWAAFAGLTVTGETLLAPPKGDETALTVALWTAKHATSPVS